MRWESDVFKTYKRVSQGYPPGEPDDGDGGAGRRRVAAGVPLLLAQGASALKVGGARAGRDADKCSAAGVLREIRREFAACAEPLPKTSFARRLHRCGRDRGARTSVKVRKEHPRRKKHQMPAPPRLKVLDDERRSRIKGLCLKDEAA
jgi:hypothetical protein